MMPTQEKVRIRVALVTNIPAPYRVPVFNLLAINKRIDLHVFYAAQREPDREWDVPALDYPHSFLKQRFIKIGRNFIHFNLDVFMELRRFDPHVVISSGLSPTYLLAFLYAKLFRRGHVAMTDGTVRSESGVTWVHRLLRRLVFGHSNAFIVASEGGRALLRTYGVADDNVFVAPLCANALVRWNARVEGPRFDFIFSARLVGVKNPLFGLDVADGVARRLGRRVSLVILGSGPLEAAVRAAAVRIAARVDVYLAGHVSQADVPVWFGRARVFLFPTAWDPWGVVANEACAAGLPSIVSPHAGAAGELIRDDVNGFVRPLDLAEWVDCAVTLLTDERAYLRFSLAARHHVESYSPSHASNGMAAAMYRAAEPDRNGAT